MAEGPSYRVPFRRRKEGKTDYRLRRALVLSKQPRLVVRPTLRHTIAQIVKAKTNGDMVITSAHSQDLRKRFGWQGSCKNLPAAYLTGLLCGYRAVAQGAKKAVLDIGLRRPSQGSRVFAVLKGALDAGMLIPHDEKVLPTEERVGGRHVADYARKLLAGSDSSQTTAFTQLSKELRPDQLFKHFALTKEKITSSSTEENT
ncbi:MAG: 50S ribosomal protein L18 [Candidatus Bathyarchaeota archaeon]|nr:MAG: 50S ribosomal protein L18 [Candidatus Bathyarchaeota archaeon]